jgi:hypothetical protein
MKVRFKSQFMVMLATLVLLLNSCSDKNNEIKVIKSYKAVIEDSVMINRLSTVQLLDYNAYENELLLLDRQTQEIILIDKKGAIISKFNPHIEGPSYVGNHDFGWTFYENEGLVCHAAYYLYQFDKKGNLIAKHPYPVETRGLWSLDYDPVMVDSYTKNGEVEVLAFITDPSGPKPNTQVFQDSVNLLYAMNFNTGSAKVVMKKQPFSVYRNLGKYVDRGWPTTAKLKNSRFAQVFSIDTSVYIFDLAKDELVNAIPIPKEFQPIYEPVDFSANRGGDKSRINASIISTGELIWVQVYGTIPASIEKEIKRNGGDNYRETFEYTQAVKKYINTTDLLFNENEFLGELKFNVGLTSYDKVGGTDGSFWLHRNYKDERDYQTFLKVKIVEDKQ